MVTHNFPPKWLLWQPKLCDISTISLLTQILNMVKIGFTPMKLQSEVLIRNTISNFTSFYLNTPVILYITANISSQQIIMIMSGPSVMNDVMLPNCHISCLHEIRV